MGILALAACVRPLSVAAQSSEKLRRIGVLMAYAPTDAEAVARVTAFVRELQRLGWTQGRNLHIQYRWAEGDTQQIAAHSAELVRLQPEAILAATTPVVRALLPPDPAVDLALGDAARAAGASDPDALVSQVRTLADAIAAYIRESTDA